jgi:electron transfer flavoprotein alpha/beta subunit
MKVLVAIKRVVDYTSQKVCFLLTKIKLKDNAVDLSGVRMYINPFCEIAMQ